jgi:hypothetical protein
VRFAIMIVLALTCSPCEASPRHSVRSDLQTLIKRQSQRVIDQPTLQDKWHALTSFQTLLVEYEKRHDLEMDVDSRIDLYEMEDLLASLPEPETFMRAKCADYRDSFLLHLRLNAHDEARSRKDFNDHERTATKILASLCR